MGAKALLTILKNGETVKAQPIEAETVLGRGEGCVIRLEDRAISRQHAVLRPTANGVQIEKKSEFAPISVNGAECTSALLKEGDVISIGPYLMRLTMGDAKAEPVEPAPAESPPAEVPAAEMSEPVQENAPVDGMNVDAPAPDPVGLEGMAGIQDASPMASAPMAGEESDEDAKTKIAPVGKLTIRLIFAPGTANVEEYEVTKDEVSIGRGKNCDIVTNGKKVSRKHAIIRRAGLSFSIKDLDSANGTYVNGVRVTEQELSGDDAVRVGDVDFVFKAISADYAAREQEFISVPDPEPEVPVAGLPGDPLGMGALEVPADGDPAAGAPADASGISGIPGLDPKVEGEKKKPSFKDLYVKYIKNFKTLPPKQKVIVLIVMLGLAFLVLGEDSKPAKKPAKKAGVTASTGVPGVKTFEQLTPEQKRYVEAQHALGFDHYRNRDYDKALFEIRKIFALIPDYKDAREIERYAVEGKRKLEALEEEKRKKEEEERLKAKIAELTAELRELMAKKAYLQAEELFVQILALDPDNAQVAAWKKEIEDFKEAERLKEQERQVQAEINKRAWDMVAEGIALKKQGKCHSAIEVFSKVNDIGATDKGPVVKASSMSKACRAFIASKRDPVLAQAKQLEEAGELAKAFQLYKQATRIDPPHRAGYEGMNRIRGVLHERSKTMYTEAIVAESYSDFDTAKKKYEDILTVAPEDDIYYERAKRKLARYVKKQEAQQ